MHNAAAKGNLWQIKNDCRAAERREKDPGVQILFSSILQRKQEWLGHRRLTLWVNAWLHSWWHRQHFGCCYMSVSSAQGLLGKDGMTNWTGASLPTGLPSWWGKLSKGMEVEVVYTWDRLVGMRKPLKPFRSRAKEDLYCVTKGVFVIQAHEAWEEKSHRFMCGHWTVILLK